MVHTLPVKGKSAMLNIAEQLGIRNARRDGLRPYRTRNNSRGSSAEETAAGQCRRLAGHGPVSITGRRPTVLRPLPRNGGMVRLLICPFCRISRRGLFAWESGGQYTTSVVRSSWGCRRCYTLRYASEGAALVQRGRGAIGRLIEFYGPLRSARPKSWLPSVFCLLYPR
jgi:hypothetical protein